jgi:hypothetical protein
MGPRPPRPSMSICSPVTPRTTSGQVEKARPTGAMVNISACGGPYAPPPECLWSMSGRFSRACARVSGSWRFVSARGGAKVDSLVMAIPFSMGWLARSRDR